MIIKYVPITLEIKEAYYITRIEMNHIIITIIIIIVLRISNIE
jgi:hypothetical protein